MKQIVLATVLALASAAATAADPLPGDAARGRLAFGQCRTCHYPEKIVGHHNGPNLSGVFGRKAGSAPGFAYYSEEMKQAGFVWTPELLDFWLANPGRFLPNSAMVVFETSAQQRADIIAYLQQFKD